MINLWLDTIYSLLKYSPHFCLKSSLLFSTNLRISLISEELNFLDRTNFKGSRLNFAVLLSFSTWMCMGRRSLNRTGKHPGVISTFFSWLKNLKIIDQENGWFGVIQVQRKSPCWIKMAN